MQTHNGPLKQARQQPALLPYRVYNISNSSPVELMDYIQALEDALGIEAKKNMLPLQPGDVLETSAETKAQ